MVLQSWLHKVGKTLKNQQSLAILPDACFLLSCSMFIESLVYCLCIGYLGSHKYTILKNSSFTVSLLFTFTATILDCEVRLDGDSRAFNIGNPIWGGCTPVENPTPNFQLSTSNTILQGNQLLFWNTGSNLLSEVEGPINYTLKNKTVDSTTNANNDIGLSHTLNPRLLKRIRTWSNKTKKKHINVAKTNIQEWCTVAGFKIPCTRIVNCFTCYSFVASNTGLTVIPQ